jgi:hypothetical protein
VKGYSLVPGEDGAQRVRPCAYTKRYSRELREKEKRLEEKVRALEGKKNEISITSTGSSCGKRKVDTERLRNEALLSTFRLLARSGCGSGSVFQDEARHHGVTRPGKLSRYSCELYSPLLKLSFLVSQQFLFEMKRMGENMQGQGRRKIYLRRVEGRSHKEGSVAVVGRFA